MNREQQEMTLWREAYRDSHCFLAQERARDADAAVEQFRLRYPAEPATAKAVWYDEPPFARDGNTSYCWVEGIDAPQVVYWSDHADEWQFCESTHRWRNLGARRVWPITKPQEPPQ